MRILTVCTLLLVVNGLAEAQQTWWQRTTAMTPEGRLIFTSQKWWQRAKELKEGERFTLDLSGDGHDDTIIARVDGDIIEAVDDTNKAANIWNQQNTTYVVSYQGSGVVDRMVSYIGNGHGGAKETEIRYFRDGYLRFAWFGESETADAAKIFALKRWQYAGNDQGSEFRGNAQIYINKYDPENHVWQPLSECPFSFWDLDGDGRTDVTLRVSAAPLGSTHSPDTDYANNYDYMWAAKATPLKAIGTLNMRLSMNLDAPSRTDPLDRPHSTFSFTSTGAQPYNYPGMRDFSVRRREPQTTIHMPWNARWTAAVTYPATATGLSWDEARQNFRWEGQFWIYERQYLSNTGSPTQRWNMRREFSEKKSARRGLYYSAADKRFHLFGAQEGWLEVGHLMDDQKDLEFRWWDSDGDGILDTVEVFRDGLSTPARVSHYNPQPRSVALNRSALATEYSLKMVPAAIKDDLAVIQQLKESVSDAVAKKYEAAGSEAISAERKRYCLDVAREFLYLKLRDEIHSAEKRNPYPNSNLDAKRFRNPSPGDAEGGYTLGDSLRYWELVRAEHQLDHYYADGDFTSFCKELQHLHLD